MGSKVKGLTQKAINSICNTGYLNVWEGAVRSGKTVASTIAWINYLGNTDEKVFILSGKTNGTLYKNVIEGDFGILSMMGKYARYYTDKAHNTVLDIRTPKGIKKCYCIGGNDEQSFTKVRGLTAGGWYADEINLQPKSFIDECFRRTIVSSDRKHFWTLNPDNPNHWIYTDFIDKYLKEEMEGFYLWKFYLDDNLAITEERKEELKRQYSGVFYRRYILGERCIAEGLVYDMFNENLNSYTELQGDKRTMSRYIAIDYGTTNPCVFLEIFDDGDDIWVEREYYWNSREEQRQKTDAEYLTDMRAFASDKNPIIIIDPSAESFRVALLNDMFYVKGARNDVLNGIRTVSNLFTLGKLHINRVNCRNLMNELQAYSWDEKLAIRGEEKPIKDKDHACDALRYFCFTILPSWRTGVSKAKNEI